MGNSQMGLGRWSWQSGLWGPQLEILTAALLGEPTQDSYTPHQRTSPSALCIRSAGQTGGEKAHSSRTVPEGGAVDNTTTLQRSVQCTQRSNEQRGLTLRVNHCITLAASFNMNCSTWAAMQFHNSNCSDHHKTCALPGPSQSRQSPLHWELSQPKKENDIWDLTMLYRTCTSQYTFPPTQTSPFSTLPSSSLRPSTSLNVPLVHSVIVTARSTSLCVPEGEVMTVYRSDV